MSKIIKMPIADWLPYLPPSYINNRIKLSAPLWFFKMNPWLYLLSDRVQCIDESLGLFSNLKLDSKYSLGWLKILMKDKWTNRSLKSSMPGWWGLCSQLNCHKLSFTVLKRSKRNIPTYDFTISYRAARFGLSNIKIFQLIISHLNLSWPVFHFHWKSNSSNVDPTKK